MTAFGRLGIEPIICWSVDGEIDVMLSGDACSDWCRS